MEPSTSLPDPDLLTNIVATLSLESLSLQPEPASTSKPLTPQFQQFSKNDEVEQSENENSLKDNLMHFMIGNVLRFKVQYMEEKCALNLKRPIDFKSLENYLQDKYRRPLNIYYTTSSKELMIQIKNQTELDHVIQLYDRTGSTKSMHLILSYRRQKSDNLKFSPLSVCPDCCESTLSDSSMLSTSIVSTSMLSASTSYLSNLLAKCAEDKDTVLGATKPPTSWREGRCLGRGAFGQVFVCLNTETGEQLALKKIYIGGNNRFRAQVFASLENEVNLLGTLLHPNIVRYLGVQARYDCVNIFMELMTGGSLKDQIGKTIQINEYGALSETNSILFSVQIFRGLSYLHSRDIVHRDIKSANILRHSSALVKIADFGSAKHIQTISTDQSVHIMGTPHYNAPEIIRNVKKYDQRSDIWSLGITIVEMLTTKTPWSDVEVNCVHIRIKNEKPDYKLPNNISPELVELISRMLEMQPEKRPTADELLNSHPFNNTKAPVSTSNLE